MLPPLELILSDWSQLVPDTAEKHTVRAQVCQSVSHLLTHRSTDQTEEQGLMLQFGKFVLLLYEAYNNCVF